MKIGIQGIKGSFHHHAATQFFGNESEIAPYENFRQVFEALELGSIDKAIVAIENSLYGSINDTYDLLIQHKPLIVGEVYLHIRLDLLAIEGAKLEDITDIYSQAPALAESKLFLRQNLPVTTQHEHPDTAMSSRFVAKQNNPKFAAIASQMTAKLYGLTSLAEEIEDHKHNYTRFVVLSAKQQTIIEANKTSIVIKTNHQPGALFDALGAFAKNKINLSKIESRPTVDEQGWEYIFYLDFEAGLNDPRSKKALAILKNYKTQVTVLGSYNRGSLPNEL